MGKIIALGHMSLDGYMADSDRQINWVKMDAEIGGFVAEFWKGATGTIYGRKTYQLMDPFWPDVLKDPGKWPGWIVDYARWVDQALKVVVTTTLTSIAWRNTRIIADHVEEQMAAVKKEAKGDLLLLGSGQLTGTLLNRGLVDEVVVTITPVLLGKGLPYFSGFEDRVGLELADERRFSNGMAGLRYRVARK
ncbi:MAG TPA: dihydrofolate reductase family protein [Puia sp.]|nr:dihydrofolate reductase family protein [Puia sp.]